VEDEGHFVRPVGMEERNRLRHAAHLREARHSQLAAALAESRRYERQALLARLWRRRFLARPSTS
jgi:hypothetical protein